MLERATSMWPKDKIYAQHVTAWSSEAMIYLYLGDFEKAFIHFEDNWPNIKKSGLLHVEYLRIYLWHLRGRCAAAMMDASDSPKPYKICKAVTYQLRKELADWAGPMADSIEGCVAIQKGDSTLARTFLQSAATGFADVEMSMFERATNTTLDRLDSAKQQELSGSCEAWFNREKIKNPNAMIRVYYPVNFASTLTSVTVAARLGLA